MSVTIREATADDADGIGRVHVAGWQVGYVGLLEQDRLDALDPAERAAQWREFAAQGLEGLVAEEDGEIVAFCAIWACTIVSFYVDPEHWDRGIGTTLLAHTLDKLAREGCRNADLWVMEGNDRARRFYAARGFDDAGETHTGEHTGRPEHRMVRRLRRPS